MRKTVHWVKSGFVSREDGEVREGADSVFIFFAFFARHFGT
jgi:hypothetical protein